MHSQYFGDSYDIVKHAIITWLKPRFSPWSVLPMFTEDVSEKDAGAFAEFSGAPLVSSAKLMSDNREDYFSKVPCNGNLLLDPDTGLRLLEDEGSRRKRQSKYIYEDDLIKLVKARPDFLTVIFDQSFSRGDARRKQLKRKVKSLHRNEVEAFAYESHACFIIAGANQDRVSEAKEKLLQNRSLLEKRIISLSDR